jgi:hypothetical protein
MRRLLERGANENDIANLKINDKALAGYRKWANKLNYSLDEVDTSGLTPEEVAKYIGGVMERPKNK